MYRAPAILVFAALGLSACGGSAPQSATESASRLLAAAVKGDRVAFEAQIDRTAVREDVRRQVAEMGRATLLDVDGGASEFALDRMISPAAFRVVRAGSGEALRTAPTPGQVARLMTQVDGRHACLKDVKAGPCLLTFAKAKDRWRLVGMKATDLTIAVAGD
ncbi:hypothetical protein [Phenylobacterium sp.]|uniref:hypothetical protein n=1 Tax=Phenylobacterium sp. TaxID=1871053 RepID=UPI0025EDF389|nr:hypothetical protein [Phenylobacterium sp.]